MTLVCFSLAFLFIVVTVLLYSIVEFMVHKLKDERKLVKILWGYKLSGQKIDTPEEFKELLIEKGILFKQNTNELINDCIDFEYIYKAPNEKDKDTAFNTTKSGRELLNFSGFLEETLKRRRRVTLLIGGTVAISVTLIITFFNTSDHEQNRSYLKYKNIMEQHIYSDLRWNLR
ncbi:MAG: hypothetical protein QG579_229 [Patescibacteria group bacterium]|jgi:hypothetical protein|nr:hypothetical protein [Patescibacteria group bacterium]